MRLERCNKINSGIAATAALLLLLGTRGVCAAGSGGGSDGAEVQELKSEVNELKAEVKDLKGEVGTLRQQEAVAAPGAPAGGGAAPAPKTVGEHVGAIEKDVGDIKKNLTYTAPVGSGINLSLGLFVTLLGEEIIPVYNNFDYNISRDFIFGFGIPFTHTGLRGQYAFNDKIGLTLGVNNGWDDISDNNDGQTVEGELSLTPISSFAMTLSGTYGPEQVNHGNSKRWAIDPVATWKTPIPGLQLIGEYLYAEETAPVSIVPAVTSNGNSLFTLPPNPTNPGVFQLPRQAISCMT